MTRPEILAPCGSAEALCSALRSGADAVYAGGKKYSARSNATNFTSDELTQAVRTCHKYGAKFYLAVNTLISDDEAPDFCKYIKFTAELGVDAYIVQDWGCAELIRKCVPDAVLHASTQMSIHTVAGAELLKSLGWTRVVPARELSRSVLKKISALDIETEVFVHGALCMSVSGQCYMSAMMGSRSANRGCCGQACRLPFTAGKNKNFSALSLKDLSLIPLANELQETGIDSLKIEGRMKRPEYVASAVNELRKSLDGQSPDMKLLKGVFSRGGFTDGYFTEKRENMFGVREKEDVVSAGELIPKIHELYRSERQVFRTDFHAVVKNGLPVTITAKCGEIEVCEKGEVPEISLSHPVTAESIGKQLSKLGDTVLYMGSLTADIDDGLFVPSAKLNSMRRSISELLTRKITDKFTPKFTVTDYIPSLPENYFPSNPKTVFRTFCRSTEQAETAQKYSEYVILDGNILMSQKGIDGISVLSPEKTILSLPRFICDEEKYTEILLKVRNRYGINRLFCNTPDCIQIGRKLGFKLHGSFSLNIFNSYSAEYMKTLGLQDCIVSFESKISQINALRTSIPLGAVVYGNVPLMLTRNCPIKNEVGCKECRKLITDRTGRNYPIVCGKDSTEILNPDCLYMLDRIGEFKNISFGLVILSTEDSERISQIFSGQKPKSITKGLYYRGI